jgi:hypothetical protein
MAAYQQQCIVCRKNKVLVKSRRQKPICDACYERHNKVNMGQDIKDGKMKKFFDINPELYKKSGFLRDIKKQYLVTEMLTQKQRDAFERVVKEMTDKNSDTDN